MALLHLVLFAPLFYLVWSLISLYQNYRIAQKTKLPILINPISGFNVFWLLSRDSLLPILDRLPCKLGAFAHRSQIGWNYHDKYGTHERLKSDAFWIVSPGSRELHIADPVAAEEVMRRSKTDFTKNPEMYQVLEIFGETVNSVNGKTWERHRRITAPVFNERISASVWDEAGRQAKGALQVWQKLGNVRSTQSDCAKLALHVLTEAGFGVSYDFSDSQVGLRLAEGHKLNYRDALRTILTNPLQIVLLRLMQKTGWLRWATFGKLQEVVDAHGEFQSYLAGMIATERETTSEPGADRTNLMSVLVRSSDQARAAQEESGGRKGSQITSTSLSDSEVYGNLFMYNLAGHDTTASTLDFALTVLALHTEWQEWIAEEIDEVFGTGSQGNERPLTYEDTFPKLTRCIALMYETLRLYGPVPSMPRWTGHSFRQLTIDGREVQIPPDTDVRVNFAGLHTHPRYWGPDPLVFRPNRWTTDHPTGQPGASAETDSPYDWQSSCLLQPVAGTFVPWNVGPRVCPGKKFAQVEFVTVISSLFRHGSRVQVARSEDAAESYEQLKTRVEKVISDAQVGIVLRMQGTNRIALKWYTKG